MHFAAGLPHHQVTKQGIAAGNRQYAADRTLLPSGKDPFDGLGIFGKIRRHIAGNALWENNLPLLQWEIPRKRHWVSSIFGIGHQLPLGPQQQHRITDKVAKDAQHPENAICLQHALGDGMIKRNKAVGLFHPAAGKPAKHHLADLAERILDRDIDEREAQPVRFLQHRLRNHIQIAAGFNGQPHTTQFRKLPYKLTLHSLIIPKKIAGGQQKIPRGKPIVGIGIIDNIDIGDFRLQIGGIRHKL